MDRIYKMMKRNNKGFTLVELMVVLLIIGILVAIAIPIYNNTQANAKAKSCQANLRTIDGAIAQYFADKDEWPTTVEQIVTAGYLKTAPICQEGDTGYKIEGTAQNTHAECPNFTQHPKHTY